MSRKSTMFGSGKKKAAPANNDLSHKIGDEMADGTIYAGISPDTMKPIYARPKDEPGTYNPRDATRRAKTIGGGFYVPTKNELNVLYKNRHKGKLRGTFNETGSNPAGWYWSSTPLILGDDAGTQRFSDGSRSSFRYYDSSLRLVR